MKRQFFLLCLTAGIIGISGCRNDALEEAVSFSIGEPTRTEFTFQAGLGSVSLQVSGSVSVTAESSAPEWCRVAVYDNSTVVYNVDTNRSEEQRSATVTISADGFPSESSTLSGNCSTRIRSVLIRSYTFENSTVISSDAVNTAFWGSGASHRDVI